MRLPASFRIAALVAAVLAAVAPSRADVGPSPGNALNPAPVNPSTVGRWMDEEGLGTRIPAARTPTGQLYNIPLDPGEEADAKPRDTWTTTGFAEFGGIHVFGDEHSQGWRNYKDLKSGPYFNNFGVQSERPDAARYFEAVGGGVGMQDQFYKVQFGRYNDWKVTAFYDSTPQVFTTTYRSLWNGVGSDSLTLATLRPGGTTNAATTQTNIQNAVAGTEYSELEVVRKKAGVRVNKTLGESWKVYASFVNEKREGARPFGGVFGGGGGGGNMETAESIDYQTNDFTAGVQYNDDRNSFNLGASASYFRNGVDTMTFQNPVYITTNGSNGLAPATFTQGRFDLSPNNEQYNVKGEYARAIPEFFRGRFTAVVALGSMRQNDDLIAPTEFPLTGGTVAAGGASLANAWNTPAALSQQSAKARIDTRLADFGFAIVPATGLDVRAKLRYYETSNSSGYMSCNPLTGQWGRLLNDGSGLSLVTANTTAGANPAGTSANAYNYTHCDLAAARALNLVPVAGNIPIGSVPYDYKQLNASLAADYRLGRASSVNATIESEGFRREFRERDETREDKIKLAYVNRGAIEGMIRISFEHDRRGGSEYNSNPYLPYTSASFGPTPATNTVAAQSWFKTIAQFRSFDQADRTQNILNGRVNYAFHPTLDGALTLQMKDSDFPSAYGRTGHQKSNSATLDLNYQAGSKAEIYSFYSYQAGSMEQKGVQPKDCIIGSTYYFYSDGQVVSAAGATPPATPPGTTLVTTQYVGAGNWMNVCASASPSSPLFPESRAWDVSSKDRNHVIGLGFKYDFGRAKLDANFTRSLGRTSIGYSYNAAALGLTSVQAALAGDGLSDLTFAQNILNASLAVPITPKVSMRLLVRYESGRIRDWHYDAAATNPMPANNGVYLDAGPQDYRDTMVGILFQVRL